MSRKRHSAEEIVNKPRQADVELGRGKPVAPVCRLLGVTEPTHYRWRKEYGGLKRLLADAELDKAILREAASGNF